MKFRMRAATVTVGTALAVWGLGAPAQAATPTVNGSVQIQGTIQCAPESKTYTVKSKPAPVRSGPSNKAAQIDVVYPGNKVRSYFHCVNESNIFICIGSCKVDESGVRGRWVFRGHVS
ncbi:hypothetical protein ACF08M_27360 [Streptomyces sp. NPDC015032]|uniref:hypothetical protein n=1 Tax=Streptomyces sp. NPDC015032 TaxID=3364937 RepID=UPI0036F5C8B2